MSKRKNRSSAPNLPQATLERARQQIAADRDGTPAPAAPPPAEAEAPKPAPTAPRPAAQAEPRAISARTRSTRRATSQPLQSRGSKLDVSDPEYVRNRLANPTRFVSEDELRQEYNYVIRDLRSMGLLAAALVVFLLVAGQFIR